MGIFTAIPIALLGMLVASLEAFNFDLDCKDNTYPDWASFTCKPCGQNQITDEQGTACRCAQTAKPPANLPLSTSFNCEDCPGDNIVNPSTDQCLTNLPTGNCAPEDTKYQVFQDDGELLAAPACF